MEENQGTLHSGYAAIILFLLNLALLRVIKFGPRKGFLLVKIKCVYHMSSLHLNMPTPRLSRTTGTFEECRLSRGLGVGLCEQRLSGRGARRGKPGQRLCGPALTRHLTAV